MSDIILSPSPNHNERPAGKAIDILLIHYTGMRDGDAALQRLRDPAAKVSSHYLIEEDGRIHRLVDESRRAWHAGAGFWAGERDINAVSIGIELGRAILARHPIPASRVLGHSDIAPTRKIDPGELFNWKALAEAGIGLWPEPAVGSSDLASIKKNLGRYGYEVVPGGTLDAATTAALQAFQRHFRPRLIDGQPDAETAALLAGLLQSLG